MRNNGKKLARLLVAALLALAMTLSLTACQVEIPGVGTININDGNAPTGGNTPDRGDTDGDGMDGGEPGAYDDSLDLLRQELDERQQDERFAVAYIGDIDGKLSDLAVRCGTGSTIRRRGCAPSIPLFGISRRSGWWATAEACSAWCPVTPTPPWR